MLSMKNLSSGQTRRALSKIGMDHSLLGTFGFLDAAVRHRYAFHRHAKHQLLSPAAGILMVETADALHVVAPTQAVWIPAGVRHATTTGNAPACSLFFPPSQYTSPVEKLKVIPVSPLMRELLLCGASSWKAPRSIVKCLFDLLHHLCREGVKQKEPPNLPRAQSPGLIKAVDWLLAHLETATPADLARQSGLSERTLRRHARKELNVTVEHYIQQARLTKAVQLLMDPRQPHNITEIALSVGYQNHSAFTAAFRRFTGQTPSRFRTSGLRQK
jgi:AraC-like DNA-binding protein